MTARNVRAAAAALIGASLVLPTASSAQRPGAGSPAGVSFEAAARGCNAFAVDLHRRLAATREGGNVLASPASIYLAMAMARVGARGETAIEMERALHLPGSNLEEISGSIGGLVSVLTRPAEGGGPAGADTASAYRMSIANALWGQEGRRLEPSFVETLASAFGSEHHEVDFIGDAEAARREINRWTAERTQGRIEEIVPPGVLGSATRLVLTNALYFKAAWFHPFNGGATSDGPFYVGGGESPAAVPTMRMRERFRYAEDERVQVVELPYSTGDVSALVILPKERNGLAAIERTITAEELDRWMTGEKEDRSVDLQLPRFRFTSEFDLGATLQAMGIRRAFTDAADFSGITREEALQISAVLHEAFVAVDENGTEAAAATSVAITLTAIPAPVEPVAVHVDHPFLFVIRHDATGAILFLGRVADPRSA